MTSPKTINISVVGVSGPEAVKGAVGVGKSLFCNRFVRPAADDFFLEHCSVLSQTDFGGSPVINNDQWIYWGDRLISNDDNTQLLVRIVEQTEFLDDETYEPIAGTSKADEYSKRCCRLHLSSRDKLMYIQKEQLGLEADFPQHTLPDGRFNVDGFVLVCDVSQNNPNHLTQIGNILTNLVRTKKPIVIALTKCDLLNEEVKQSIINLIISRKDLKNVHMPPIEISAIHDVNIDDVFHTIASFCSKHYKYKTKPLSYYEAANYVEQRNVQIKNAYINLLSQLLPMNTWQTNRFDWKSVLSEIDRHRDYTNLVHVYGRKAAHRIYEKYMLDAKEFWMNSRLRLMLPQLPRVLRTIFEKIDISEIDWTRAKSMIMTHPLFDDFFQQIGELPRQLDHLTPDRNLMSPRQDSRLPAEILILPEAKKNYEEFRAEVRENRIREKMEDDFEYLLSETPEVTPGKSLNDASIFLQGSAEFENLPQTVAIEVYERYQRLLVKRAESQFIECLLEYVELLTKVIQNSHSTAANEAISIEDLKLIKDFLEQDRRYRWMSMIFDLRDHLIYSITSFYRLPSTSTCPAGPRCIDSLIIHALDRFFHRRNDHSYTHLIDIVVHGETGLVSQFISELSSFLRNDPFPCSSGAAFIRCFGEQETDRRNSIFTDVFLIDSTQTLEELKSKPINMFIPPIFVVVCDPSNFDLIPVLHQQGASLAAKVGASFFGSSRDDGIFPTDDMASTNIASDCSSLLSRDQLMSICESICSSQLTHRKRDFRVQMSLMCADCYSIESLIADTFGNFEQFSTFRPIVHPNLIAGGVVPIDVSENENKLKLRVELAFCSYHSWFSPSTCYKINATQAHVLVYYVRRPASFEHARTAICRLLDRKDLEFITPKSIFLIAVAERDDDQNTLLIEGAELCHSIGCRFHVIRGGGANQNLTEELIDFFGEIHRMILNGGSKKQQQQQQQQQLIQKKKEQLENEEDGYASLVVEHVRPTSLHLSNMTTMATNGAKKTVAASQSNNNLAFQNLIARSEIDKKKKPSSRPSALKMREPRISRSGPILLPQYRKSQPDIQIAPLATPEAVEIAPEYSLVKDALISDEGLYETLDFGSTSSNEKSTNHLDLPTSTNNIIQDPISRRLCRPTTTTPRRPRTACISSSPDPTSRLHRTVNLLAPTEKMLSNSKSITAPLSLSASSSTFRQSMSAESLVEIMQHEKKVKKDSAQNRFVRKVATSFRFRKDKIEEKRDEGRKSEERVKEITASPEQIAAFREKMASRSLPQSPHMERKSKIYTSLTSANEKMSSALSWISPKKGHKEKSSTNELHSSVSSSISTSSSAQGVISSEDTLQTLCAASSSGVPIYIEKCVNFIENNGGFEHEGLYRVSGNQAHLAEVEKKYLQTGNFDVSSVDIPVHVAATAHKNFFNCLPTPLIPKVFHDEIKKIMTISDVPQRISKLKEVIDEFPSTNRNVLKYLTKHLSKVSCSPKTVMDTTNLSKVWAPTLFRPNFDSYEELATGLAGYQLATESIFANYAKIF